MATKALDKGLPLQSPTEKELQKGFLKGRSVKVLAAGTTTLSAISLVAYAAFKTAPLWAPFLMALGPIGCGVVVGAGLIIIALATLGIVYAAAHNKKHGSEQDSLEEAKPQASSSIALDPEKKASPDPKESAKIILEWQEQLHSVFTAPDQKREIYKMILNEFALFRYDHEKMYQLRKTIDKAGGTGVSKLFHLIYHDVDAETGQNIIQLINDCFALAYAKHPEVKRDIRIYTDIDDTVKGSLNDRAAEIPNQYPAGLMVYQNLAMNAKQRRKKEANLAKSAKLKMTVLSARPGKLEGLWKHMLGRDFPKGSVISCLFGSTDATGNAIKHYTVGKMMRMTDQMDYFDASEEVTYEAFAKDKRQNIDRDLLLWPEANPIMFGDTGEGDLLFIMGKNGTLPSPAPCDPRIPENYYHAAPAGINAPNTPLFMGFAHAISSRAEKEYRTTISGRKEDQLELQAQGIYIINNFVDIAIQCYQKQLHGQRILNEEQLQAIVHEAEIFLEPNIISLQEKMQKYQKLETAEFDQAMDTLPPPLRYRLRLVRSIEQAKQILAETK